MKKKLDCFSLIYAGWKLFHTMKLRSQSGIFISVVNNT